VPQANTLARFSADGAWLAVTALQAGRSEVYVLSTLRPTVQYRISVTGGEEPRWSRDGRRIVFRYGSEWFEASFTAGNPPSVGPPQRLFEGQYENVPGYSYDLFPDGRYLLLQPPTERTTRRLTVITDLPGLLRDGGERRQ
jgi:Tol biopolymer transport system component